MSKPEVNKDLCIGCGTCEALCPTVFAMEDGKSKVVSEECGDCDCQEAVDNCPVNAISIVE
ncbi:MAG: ferredoxin [Candidatus Moranbacteria bacterium]|nr:ferredoxin [Candidatus Moranbacteria bacterium]